MFDDDYDDDDRDDEDDRWLDAQERHEELLDALAGEDADRDDDPQEVYADEPLPVHVAGFDRLDDDRGDDDGPDWDDPPYGPASGPMRAEDAFALSDEWDGDDLDRDEPLYVPDDWEAPDPELADEAHEAALELNDREDERDDDAAFGNDSPDEDAGETGPVNQL